MSSPEHDALVARARQWLIGTGRMGVALAEPWGTGRERPDALGWNMRGWSILVECKVSRPDFNADKLKRKRYPKAYNMGQERYYMTPPGLLIPQDIPPGWGLLEAGKRVRRIVLCPRVSKMMGEHGVQVFTPLNEEIRKAEWGVLYAAMFNVARAELMGRKVP